MKKIQQAFFEKMRFYFLYLMKQVREQEVRLLKEVPLNPSITNIFFFSIVGLRKKMPLVLKYVSSFVQEREKVENPDFKVKIGFHPFQFLKADTF